MLYLYTDAAVRGNPGPAAGGVLIVHHHKQIQLQHFLGTMDNHRAEFGIAIWAFDYLIDHGMVTEIVAFHSDSRLLVDSLNKRYAKHFDTYLQRLLAQQAQFEMVLNQWLPDHENRGAHQLAMQALQKH